MPDRPLPPPTLTGLLSRQPALAASVLPPAAISGPPRGGRLSQTAVLHCRQQQTRSPVAMQTRIQQAGTEPKTLHSWPAPEPHALHAHSTRDSEHLGNANGSAAGCA